MPRRTIHGIDPYAPGGVEALIEFNRGLWGDMQMNANDGGESGGESGGNEGSGEGQSTESSTEGSAEGQLAKALNPDAKGNEKPTADQLTKQLAERDTAAKQAQTELTVYKLAGKHGADADALLDSRAFLAKIAELDHTKTADVEKAIKEAVESNPKLKSVRVAGSSTADGAGGSGEKAKKNTGLGDALAGHYATN